MLRSSFDSFVTRALLVGLCALDGCTEPAFESEPVASFALVASLDQNTCGPLAVTLPDPWMRTAQLSKTDVGLFLWKEASGVVSQGTRTAGGEYRFRGTSTNQLVPADPTRGYPGCTVRLDDDLRFELSGDPTADGGVNAGADAGAALTLTGTQTTLITIVSGSDCTPVLNSSGQGGNFLALPCQFAYDLSGEPSTSN
jgi:hypothetical protein